MDNLRRKLATIGIHHFFRFLLDLNKKIAVVIDYNNMHCGRPSSVRRRAQDNPKLVVERCLVLVIARWSDVCIYHHSISERVAIGISRPRQVNLRSPKSGSRSSEREGGSKD